MTAKAGFHARVWHRLASHAEAHALLPRGARVLAAVSGGPDSVCLADFLARVAERRGLKVALAHFHHGLRGRSADRDAAFVRGLARRLGVPLYEERLRVREAAESAGRGLEEAGRALRYRALYAIARRRRLTHVATGHQLDDQAETVLLHLLRGTRPEGLAGIPEKRPLGPGVELVRPLLCLTREEVLEYLEYRKLGWRTDPTNRSRKFRRNWVRLELLPLLEKEAPGIRSRLATLASGLRRALRSRSKPADGSPGRGPGKERPRPARRASGTSRSRRPRRS